MKGDNDKRFYSAPEFSDNPYGRRKPPNKQASACLKLKIKNSLISSCMVASLSCNDFNVCPKNTSKPLFKVKVAEVQLTKNTRQAHIRCVVSVSLLDDKNRQWISK
jgi:hypothetical protein